MNSLANEGDTIPSTGRQDSVLIAYDDLRKVNGKLVELDCEREINKNLRNIVHNDSIAIDNLKSGINRIYIEADKKVKKAKRERNIASGIGIGAIVLLIISIL
jgi:hypothetical protein